MKRLFVWLKTRSLPWLEFLQRHFPHPVAWLGRRWRKVHQGGTLARWTRGLWWKNWGMTLGTFLALSLLLDFANLAGDLAKNKVSILVFFHYWFWNLPPFLAVVLPITFLLAGALSISQAALSREWVALRAGGVSFLQWSLTGARAWGGVLLLTLSLQAFVAPIANPIADSLYRNITNKPPRPTSRPWLYLGGTGVLWRLEGDTRWGFPLKSVGSAPILLHWKRDDAASTALPWYGLQWQGGPEAHRLFPEASLRQRAQAEDATTAELVQWQRWAPDPERSSMLWSRLLNWLAGPCLLFAILPHVFPRPRGGRGRVLGVALIAGLLFMGTQALFGGAARAGEIPGFWGVLAPLMGLAGFGFLGLPRLKT
ncbi:MAG: LptF/LptG family permease [Firmicutes bacterium]|nr:LptF/LptG family permease [Bacillota bacterium]